MFRGMARLVGAAAVGVASAPPCPEAFCHARLPSSPTLHHSSSPSFPPKPPSLSLRLDDDVDDWEYPGPEDWIDGPNSHLVFAPVPSEEEVEEATKELHAALHLSIPLSPPDKDASSDEPSQRVLGDTTCETPPSISETEEEVDLPLKTSSVLSNHLGLLAAGSSPVYEAFHLLQTNPQVQGVVKSLACDPAVWNAVLNNEKVKKLTQCLYERDENLSDKKPVPPEDESGGYKYFQNATSKVYDYVAQKVLQLIDSIAEIVSSIFGSVEKTFFMKEESNAVDKTVASCMLLAVAVLLVVMIKRVAVK